MSPIVNSQDCCQLNSLTFLYLGKYAWGIVQFVQTKRAWLKVPKQQRRRTSIKSRHKTIEKHKHWSGKIPCTIEEPLKKLEKYMCLMIDGMNQKKTCLPHLRRLRTDVNDECLIQMHLVGCLAYNGVTVKPHVFITYPSIVIDTMTRWSVGG